MPRNRSRIRRFDASGRFLKIALGGAAALGLVFAGAVTGLLYYRTAYLGTEGLRVQAAQFLQERAALMGRVAELESSLGRVERFAAKVESSANKGREPVGQGPIEETESLPDLPTATAPEKLGEGMWKSPFSKSLTAGLDLSLKNLSERTGAVEGKLHSAFSLQQEKLYFWASLPSAWPTHGWVTSEFGDGRGRRMHEGVDIAGPVGTPILAPGSGIVTYSGYRAGYGRAIIIDHGSKITTLYGHCSAVYVEEGQHVNRGMLIAAVGNTGRSTGPHLHYEVHVDGVPVNPMRYLAGKM